MNQELIFYNANVSKNNRFPMNEFIILKQKLQHAFFSVFFRNRYASCFFYYVCSLKKHFFRKKLKHKIK